MNNPKKLSAYKKPSNFMKSINFLIPKPDKDGRKIIQFQLWKYPFKNGSKSNPS